MLTLYYENVEDENGKRILSRLVRKLALILYDRLFQTIIYNSKNLVCVSMHFSFTFEPLYSLLLV